jgi:hypothetical protein
VFDTHQTEALRVNVSDRESDPGRNDSQAMKLVRGAVMRALDGREHAFEDAVKTAVSRVLDALAGGFVPGDVSAEQAEAVLASLEERRGRHVLPECAERESGRLKNEYGLAPLRVRGLERVALHADLVMLARLSQALSRARAVPLAA